MSLLWTKDKLWFNEARAEQIGQVLREGFHITQDGQLKPVSQGAAYDIPWVFIGDNLPHHCHIWNEMYFRKFGLIPRWCRTKCHKVVVSVPNVARLMDLHELMNFMHTKYGLNGKCGMDVRTYTWGFWRGFFYNTSMEKGLECLEIVRSVISENLGPAISVILKKGCTEYERTSMGGIPSNEWGEPTPEQADLEDHLDNLYYQGEEQFRQPPWLRQKIMLNWWLRAYSFGDTSLWEFLDRDWFESLISAVRSVTYEPQPEPVPDSGEEGGDPK